MDNRTGMIISGAGHGALILWIAVGGLFVPRDRPDEVTVTQVALVSSEEYAAIEAAAPAPSEKPAETPNPAPAQSPVPVPRP